MRTFTDRHPGGRLRLRRRPIMDSSATSIMVSGKRQPRGMWFTPPMHYLGQARAKKVSDLREYDVIITTHAVRLFCNRLAIESEPLH